MSKTETTKKPTKAGTYHHGDLRAALLEAAETVLEENGIEGFSLRAVAKQAGVSHAAPAHHFGDTAGLLTALAAVGYQRFMAAQEARQANAEKNASSQMQALGLGYVDFALQHPALFRLVFSSDRTNYEDETLAKPANQAFEKLVDGTRNVAGIDPYTDNEAMIDVLAAWAMVHGLADLLNAGRLGPLQRMSDAEREEVIKKIVGRLRR